MTASEDKTARVWDAQTGQPLTEPLKHAGAVCFSAIQSGWEADRHGFERQHCASVGCADGPAADRALKHGDVGVFRAIQSGWEADRHGFGGQHRAGVGCADRPATDRAYETWQTGSIPAQFSPDGKRIVTASDDGTARVWDAQTGQPLTEPMKHGNVAVSAQFSPDGKRIVTASQDKTARVWDAQTGQPLTEPYETRRRSDFSAIQSGWEADRHGFARQHSAGVGCADRPAADRASETRRKRVTQRNSVPMGSGSSRLRRTRPPACGMRRPASR